MVQDGRLKSLWARYYMNRWLGRIEVGHGGSLGISDSRNLEKNDMMGEVVKTFVGEISYEPLVGSLGIGNDLINIGK